MRAFKPVKIIGYMICFCQKQTSMSGNIARSLVFFILNKVSQKPHLRVLGLVQYHVTFQITSYEFILQG